MFLIGEDYWEVRITKEKGSGIFAKKSIGKGAVIGDYLGMVVRNSEYDLSLDEKGLYLMYLSDQASIYPDLSHPGIHLLNHSCRPNCGMYIYQGHTLFFAIRKILPYEELTISYMLNPNICKICTHQCQCGEIDCRKTMHLEENRYKLWENFKKREAQKTKKVRFRYGNHLPQLKSYPKKILVDSIYKEISGMKYRTIS